MGSSRRRSAVRREAVREQRHGGALGGAEERTRHRWRPHHGEEALSASGSVDGDGQHRTQVRARPPSWRPAIGRDQRRRGVGAAIAVNEVTNSSCSALHCRRATAAHAAKVVVSPGRRPLKRARFPCCRLTPLRAGARDFKKRAARSRRERQGCEAPLGSVIKQARAGRGAMGPRPPRRRRRFRCFGASFRTEPLALFQCFRGIAASRCYLAQGDGARYFSGFRRRIIRARAWARRERHARGVRGAVGSSPSKCHVLGGGGGHPRPQDGAHMSRSW